MSTASRRGSLQTTAAATTTTNSQSFAADNNNNNDRNNNLPLLAATRKKSLTELVEEIGEISLTNVDHTPRSGWGDLQGFSHGVDAERWKSHVVEG